MYPFCTYRYVKVVSPLFFFFIHYHFIFASLNGTEQTRKNIERRKEDMKIHGEPRSYFTYACRIHIREIFVYSMFNVRQSSRRRSETVLESSWISVYCCSRDSARSTAKEASSISKKKIGWYNQPCCSNRRATILSFSPDNVCCILVADMQRVRRSCRKHAN